MKNRKFHEWIKRVGSVICVRIKKGPLKGYKWIVTTGSSFIRGVYEMQKTEGILKSIKPGMNVLDVGAHVGYYSLIMAKKVGSEGSVCSFEPRDLNRSFLEKHIRINKITNIKVFSECVGDREGATKFESRTGTGTGHISDSGNLNVRMTTIDSAIANGRVNTPDYIKIDVEGAEMMVLLGGAKTIESRKPILLLATHSDKLEKKCRDFLEPMGYNFQDLEQDKGDTEFLVTQS